VYVGDVYCSSFAISSAPRGPGSAVRIIGTGRARSLIGTTPAAMLPEKSYVIARREQAQFFALEHAAQKTRPQKHFRL
jgi:hypothetical protein